MGSTVSIAVGLGLTLVVFVLLQDQSGRLDGELRPLLQSLGVFALAAGLASASFYAELRHKPWRNLSFAALALALLVLAWTFWPR
jgi:hypothetical protein